VIRDLNIPLLLYAIHGEKNRPSRQQQGSKETRIMHSNVESVPTKLQRIAKKASKDKDCQFTSLYHLMNKELQQSVALDASIESGNGEEKQEIFMWFGKQLTILIRYMFQNNLIDKVIKNDTILIYGMAYIVLQPKSRDRNTLFS